MPNYSDSDLDKKKISHASSVEPMWEEYHASKCFHFRRTDIAAAAQAPRLDSALARDSA